MASCSGLSRCGASSGITPKGTERSSHGLYLLFPVMAIGASRRWPSYATTCPGRPRCETSLFIVESTVGIQGRGYQERGYDSSYHPYRLHRSGGEAGSGGAPETRL